MAHLTIAPLRDRPVDILPLAKHFLTAYALRPGAESARFTPDAEAKLLAHRWPGNIR